jgi:Ku70/Ku80-like protein
MGVPPRLLREAHAPDQHLEPTDGELRLIAAMLVRPLSHRGAKSGEGKEYGYKEETCASRIHKGRRGGAAHSFESEFVDRSEIDPRYLIRPYYLRPDGKVGHDAFAVIRETSREMKKVAIG